MSTSTSLISDNTLMRIGELAEGAGVTTRTLRYWEEIGLMAPVGRQQGGQRLYSADDLRRVTRIRDLQDLLGLSLAEIRAVLDADDILDRLRRAKREGVRVERRVRLLEQAIAANDLLVKRLDDTLSRVEEFRRERVALGKRMRERARELQAATR